MSSGVVYELCLKSTIPHNSDKPTRDGSGNFLKSIADIKPGQIIFSEAPLVFGPRMHIRKKYYGFPCVACCKLLNNVNTERCKACFWPICSQECRGLTAPNLHGFECTILRLRPPLDDVSKFYEHYRFDVLVVLRALFLQKTDTEKWEQLMKLDDNLAYRRPGTKIYHVIEEKSKHLQEHYLNPSKDRGILSDISSSLIHKIYGIFNANCKEIDNFDAIALYSISSSLEHDCTPNTVQTIDENDDFKITFRAAIPIKEDDHITNNYTNILWGTTARKQHIKQSKHFLCKCKRCKDPLEFGTYFNGLICMGGENNVPCGGVQLAINPADDNCWWICKKCHIKLPEEDLMLFVQHLGKEVEKVMSRNVIGIVQLEDLMKKLLNFLHPNHYIIFPIKLRLVQLYCKDEKFEEELDKKLKLIQDLTGIIKALDPGNTKSSKFLALLLDEEFDVNFKQLSRSSDEDQSLRLIENMRSLLQEMKKVLVYERDSLEGQKLSKIADNEVLLQNWINKKGS